MTRLSCKSKVAVGRVLLGVCLPIVWSAAVAAADDLFPDELVRFVPYSQNPIFTAGGKGHWDEWHCHAGRKPQHVGLIGMLAAQHLVLISVHDSAIRS